MRAENLKNINTTVLAYMGDAVYEQAVREHVIKTGIYDEEQKLVKRARNRKTATKAKNADPVTYKWATAFEALIGYLYLAGDDERLEQLMKKAIEIAGK